MSSEASMIPFTANDKNPELAVKNPANGGVPSGMKAGFEDGVSSVEPIGREIPVQMTTGESGRKSVNKESAGDKFSFLN